jgi:hypothetical protein
MRSAHPPTGSFVSPCAGSRVGRTGITAVHWRALDADGDRLTSTAEYSPDRGRHWKVLADGVTGEAARIPSRFLSASRDARIRVRISDGFDATTVESGRLRAVGAPPFVQIIVAPRRGHVVSTATLLLQADAFDDTGRPLTGRKLRWYLGRRLIGHGDQLPVHDLQPGNAVIRLIATDPEGRSAQATVALRVRAVAARYLLFDAPLLVPARARAVRITLASSAPATFTIAGRRYAVGPGPRAVTVRIRHARSPLVLPCSLSSPGGVIHGTYVALRRRR